MSKVEELFKLVASMQEDSRVAEAIIDRYDNLSKWSDRTINLL